MTERAAHAVPLRCPHCHEPLHRAGPTWSCVSGHAFDVARQGYVNLLVGPPAGRPSGDGPAMLDARQAVHDTGLFASVADTVAEVVAAHGPDLPEVVAEVGAGNGWWVDRLRAALGAPVAVAIDASTAAGRRAARSSVTAVVADAWGPWPLLDDVVDVLLNVFAPRNVAEAVRVLGRGGVVVSVVPGAGHLAEVVGPLGMLAVPGDRDEEVVVDADPDLVPVDRRRVVERVALSRQALVDLAMMGPAGHHRGRGDLQSAAADLADPTTVTVDCHVLVLARDRPQSDR